MLVGLALARCLILGDRGVTEEATDQPTVRDPTDRTTMDVVSGELERTDQLPWRVDSELTHVGDRQRLIRVLFEQLQHACNFTIPGGAWHVPAGSRELRLDGHRRALRGGW